MICKESQIGYLKWDTQSGFFFAFKFRVSRRYLIFRHRKFLRRKISRGYPVAKLRVEQKSEEILEANLLRVSHRGIPAAI